MRHLRRALAAAACAVVPASGMAIEADDVAWGCEDAGYVRPAAGDAGAFRGMLLLVHTDMGVIPATFELPEGQVYADGAPRCADLDGDGEDEVIAVVSDADRGARLVVYSKRRGPITETPAVGQGGRLSPAGTADFDGDGRAEIATVERSDGAGRLRLWALRDGALSELASAGGFGTGLGGEDGTSGGVRDCGTGPELVLANEDGSALMRVRLRQGRLAVERLAAAAGAESVAAALACGAAQAEENG